MVLVDSQKPNYSVFWPLPESVTITVTVRFDTAAINHEGQLCCTALRNGVLVTMAVAQPVG